VTVFPQGASAGAVKKPKVESWEKSVGKLGGGGALASLVVRKKPDATAGPAAPPAGRNAKPGEAPRPLDIAPCVFTESC